MGMIPGAENSYFPNGNILIGSFVKLDTSAEGYVLQCGSGEAAVGIAGVEPHSMSITIQGVDLGDLYAGVAGGPAIKIYGVGATNVPLRVGTGGAVAVGDRLIADASGLAVTSTSDKVKVGAIARQAGAASTWINVDVVRFDTSV